MRFGIDLGGTKTEIIALDEGGTEIYRKRVDTDPISYEAIVATIAGLVQEKVAVGTPVTRRPPHRSVLEELPHTALALGNNAKAN
jgi:predicted NBD/HSP70 family sugar kinase